LRPQVDGFVKAGDLVPLQRPSCAALQAAELDGPETNADQPTDREIERFKHAANFAVSSFAQRDMQPFVAARAAAFLDAIEAGGTVVELHSLRQAF
jgi:hypothetical protein